MRPSLGGRRIVLDEAEVSAVIAFAASGKRTKVIPVAPGLNVTDGDIFLEPLGNVQA